jgi:sigma-E factor negative regulatory protein RseB
MSASVRAPANWLIPCAMVGVLLIALPQAGRAGADDPRVWLEKMNQALETRNYDGMFMHVSDGHIETMRIVHRVLAGRVTERLSSMDGPGREFVRTNDELTCYLPDKKTILVESRPQRGPFLGSLPQFGAGVNEFYEIDALPSTRVLGKPVRVIAVNPKDQFRFGYRLWLDEKSAMPLKTQLCDARGNVIEQIVFARLDMPETIPDAELAPTVRTEGMRVVHQIPGDNGSTDLAGFRASQLPPGFHLTVAGAQTLGGASVPAAHLVYSDGLATVSVFVEAGRHDKSAAEQALAEEPPREGLVRMGSGFVYSTVVQGHQVTAVGEVPAQTVEFIGRSVKLSSGGELTQH